MNVSSLRQHLDELLESESIHGKLVSTIASVARNDKWEEFKAAVGDYADELENEYHSGQKRRKKK